MPSPYEDDDDEPDDEDEGVEDAIDALDSKQQADLAREAFYKGTETKRETKEVWVGVLPSNRAAVDTYLGCEWTVLVGFSATATIGISAREINASMVNVGVPRSLRRDTTQRVQCMVRAARPYLNKKATK